MIWVGGDVGKAKDHHPNQIRMEAVYQPYEFQGTELLIETKLNTEEGKLYQEVELPGVRIAMWKLKWLTSFPSCRIMKPIAV
jgi:hypothetical protein